MDRQSSSGRSTLCGWIASVADLLEPLFGQMCHRILRSHVIQTDDTGVKMLAEGQCLNAKFWMYLGDTVNRCVAYEFSLTREGKNPSQFLKPCVATPKTALWRLITMWPNA